MDADGDEEDGDEGEVEDGVYEYGETTRLEVAERHHPPVPRRQLEQKPRREQHEQHHRDHHRPPIRHPNYSPTDESLPKLIRRRSNADGGGEEAGQRTRYREGKGKWWRFLWSRVAMCWPAVEVGVAPGHLSAWAAAAAWSSVTI